MRPPLDKPWIRFLVRDLVYALPLDCVAEVSVAKRPRLIPLVPIEMGGVVNVKGEPLPALNGGSLLQGEPTKDHRHLLILERESVRVGLLVGSVSRIDRELRPAPVQPHRSDHGGPQFVHWILVAGETIGLVDPEALLHCIA